MNCYDDLMWRGLIQDISSQDLIEKLKTVFSKDKKEENKTEE